MKAFQLKILEKVYKFDSNFLENFESPIDFQYISECMLINNTTEEACSEINSMSIG